MHPIMEALPIKKRLFVVEYIKDWDHRRAAERVGFVAQTGYNFINDPDIIRAIAVAMEERMQRTEIDADWVLMQLGEFFNSDLADLFVPGTDSLRPIHEWPPVWRKLATSLKVTESFDAGDNGVSVMNYIKEVKIPDRLKVLELIGKHTNVKAFTERVEIATDSELNDRLQKGRQRLAAIKVGENKLSFL